MQNYLLLELKGGGLSEMKCSNCHQIQYSCRIMGGVMGTKGLLNIKFGLPGWLPGIVETWY